MIAAVIAVCVVLAGIVAALTGLGYSLAKEKERAQKAEDNGQLYIASADNERKQKEALRDENATLRAEIDSLNGQLATARARAMAGLSDEELRRIINGAAPPAPGGELHANDHPGSPGSGAGSRTAAGEVTVPDQPATGAADGLVDELR